MKEALIVAIVFGSLVLIPAVIGGTIIMSIKLLKGGTSRKDQAEDDESGPDIVEHHAEVGEEVPVEADRDVLLLAAVQALVVQVEPRVASPDLPCAPIPVLGVEGALGRDAALSSPINDTWVPNSDMESQKTRLSPS